MRKLPPGIADRIGVLPEGACLCPDCNGTGLEDDPDMSDLPVTPTQDDLDDLWRCDKCDGDGWVWEDDL